MKNILAILLLSSNIFFSQNVSAAFVGSISGDGNFLFAAYDQDINQVGLSASGGKGGVNAYLTVTNMFTKAGAISFDWRTNYQPGISFSIGYLINGTETELGFRESVNFEPQGTNAVIINAGDTFGWYLRAAGIGETSVYGTISNISFVSTPSAVPENNIALMMAGGLICIAALKKKALI